jgi:hypothetical protein
MSKVTIHAQATAVERAYLNLRGHRDNVHDLATKGKRPLHEVAQIDAFLADLEPAVATMQWLVENEAKIKAALEKSHG